MNEFLNNFYTHANTYYMGVVLSILLLLPILIKRKYWFITYPISVIVFFVIFYFIPSHPFSGYPIFLPKLKQLSIPVFYTAIMLISFKFEIKSFLFTGVNCYVIQHLILCVAETLGFAFGFSYATNRGVFALVEIGIAAILSSLFIIFQWPKFKKIRYVRISTLKMITIIIMVLIISLTIQSDALSNNTINFHYRFLESVLFIFLLFVLQLELIASNAINEKIVMKELFKSEKERYLLLETSMREINRKYHDFKYIEKAWSESKVQEFINSNYKEEYDEIAVCDNIVLSNIITSRSLICKKEEIEFSYIVDDRKISFIEPIDLSIMFGNLLDNAIECVKKYDKSNKIISLKISVVSGAIAINLENYCEDDIQFVDKIPISSKNNQHNHGYGLKSVQYIVDKYGGYISFVYKNNRFMTNAIIPISENYVQDE